MLINVHFLVCHWSVQESLKHGHEHKSSIAVYLKDCIIRDAVFAVGL